MRPLILMSSLTLFAACGGGGLEGTYLGEDAASGERTGFLDSITFKSGNQLEATFLGQTKHGTYTVNGKQVTLKVADDDTPELLTILDDGCLEGNAIVGRYCRGGKGNEKKAAAERDATQKKATALVGTYEARHAASGQGLRLEFGDQQTVTLTFIGAGAPPGVSGPYSVDGDRISISGPPGEAPMVLTRDGDALVMKDDAESVRFVRQ
ncbi:MAG TPA: hypothetical protein VLD59_15985 [Steroidobacteraceae bacterium]|nr:hypothetical protein [Steroidobacteraceae bacterium]